MALGHRCLLAPILVASIILVFKSDEMVEERQMRWFGHASRINSERLTTKVWEIRPKTQKGKGRSRKTWINGAKAVVEMILRWENPRLFAQD